MLLYILQEVMNSLYLQCIKLQYFLNSELSATTFFNKACVNHLLEANHEIYESSQFQYQDQNNILKRFVNCFSKT